MEGNKTVLSTEIGDPILDPLLQRFSLKRELIPGRIVEKIEELLRLFQQEDIDSSQLKTLSFNGIPDDLNGLRSLAWKIILGYLPSMRSTWSSHLKEMRRNYYDFVEEFLTPKTPKNSDLNKQPEEEKVDDHPLSNKSGSQWKVLFEDLELWETVEKDTKRTRADMDFFQKPTLLKREISHKFVGVVKKYKSFQEPNEYGDKDTHNQALQRILFIYAKLHKALGYVQGMNEILAPIYYCFANDPDEDFKENAEPDAFWCFQTLMAEIKDSFVRKMDTSDYGIKTRVARLHELLKDIDEDLWIHFEQKAINPMYYSLRWLMLFFTQEFELGDVLTLWDSLLSQERKLEFVYYIALAVLLHKRDGLLQKDFAEILEDLRKIDDVKVFSLLVKANELYNEFHS
eukprot:TRINITY_DN1235_c0_g1_i1.p1 TRINITY_DN1235_c0_g1~~TRINITY_DN1235_c0_g1_i1.p1  ORF type:complete len:400 (-),score=74.96 TRINITY_DN1235_c0_g1_i1:107-1306(-)